MSLNLATKAILLLFVPLFTTSYPQHACASTIDLPSDVADLVPACVMDCLSAFVNENFASSSCGSQPTLQCLCARIGTTGYTVGEGALSCVSIEDKSGYCSGENATASVSTRAYEICSGQTSAAPETHATLIATLVVQTSTATSASSTSSHLTTAGPTTARQTDMTPPASTTTSFTASLTASSTPPSTPSKVSATASAAAAQSTELSGSSPSEGLSTPAIIGISVGATVAFLFLAGLYLLVRKTRRRRRLEGTGPALDERSSDSREASGFKRHRESHSHEMEISLPINLDPRGLGLAGNILANTNGRWFEDARPPPEYAQGALAPAMTMIVPPHANQPLRVPPPNEASISRSRSQSRSQSGLQPWRGVASSQPQATGRNPEITNVRSQYQQTLALPQRVAPLAQERESIITEFAEDGEPYSAADRMPERNSELFWPRPSSPTARSLVSGMLDGYGSGWTSEGQLQSGRKETPNGRRAAGSSANANVQNPFVVGDRQSIQQAREQRQSGPVFQPQINQEGRQSNTYNSRSAPMQYPPLYSSKPRAGTRLEGVFRQPGGNRRRWELPDESTVADFPPTNLTNKFLDDGAQWPSPAPVPPLKDLKRASQRAPKQMSPKSVRAM